MRRQERRFRQRSGRVRLGFLVSAWLGVMGSRADFMDVHHYAVFLEKQWVSQR